MPGSQLRLLALDGGGVRGLSSLMILRRLMATVAPEASLKPCDYFDMIGGTSTGGLIAIMLGRLRMTVDECIDAYTSLSDKVFEKKYHRVKINGKLQGRYDKTKLEQAIKQILIGCGLSEDALLKDVDAACKVFVCATSKETGDAACLTNYRSLRTDNSDLLNTTTIWQACRATSAATTFFDPIAIGPFGEEFVDGALGANNPIFELWNQAQDVWGDELEAKLGCLVSIGTGLPSLQPVKDDILGISTTLKKLATETEKTAQRFHRDKSSLDNQGRYYRFNVVRGLEEIGLEESKKRGEIAAATRRYVESQDVFKQMRACANNISGKEYFGPYRTTFDLRGVPVSNNFVERSADTVSLERCLLPSRRSGKIQRRLFVLHGLGGIGKTQLAVNFARRYQATFSSIFWLDGRSEDNLKQSLASCAKRIPQGQIPDKSRTFVSSRDKEDLEAVVVDVLDWLARPDNIYWLLVLDNVDLDHEQGGVTGAYDVRQYLPGDHGSVLITTRLSRLAQLGDSKQLKKANKELSQAIFNQWYGAGRDIGSFHEVLVLLDGLPLALAQAASYLRETGSNATSYIRLYQQQWDELIGHDDKNEPPLLDYEHSIGTTWMLSFKAIESRSESAANLLRLWAFVNNKDMWHGLLQAATDRQKHWPTWLREMACSEAKYLETARLLLRYSMIGAQESVSGSYIMHQVVHRWTSQIQNTTMRREYVQLAVVIVGCLVPSDTSKDSWILQRRLLPHADRCSWWVKEVGDIHNLDDTTTMHSIHLLGLLYADQGRLQDAEAMYDRALRGREKTCGPEHTDTLDTVNHLGGLYIVQGRLQDAEAMCNRALRGYEKTYGPEHINTLGIINNLGGLYEVQGRLQDAEAMYDRALRGKEKTCGPEHTDTLHTVNNLGILYIVQGRLQDAEAMCNRALRGREKTYGPEHIDTLDTVNNLGGLYADQGRLQDAKAMYDRVFRGYEKIYGPEHIKTLEVVHNLGTVYEAQGRLQDAEAMYDWALRGYEKALGLDTMSTYIPALNTFQALGYLYRDLKEMDKARSCFERAQSGICIVFGYDSERSQKLLEAVRALPSPGGGG